MRNVIRAAILAGTALVAPTLGSASSHREAPNITRFPGVDSTDLYMFMSYETGREDYVTVLANYIPLQAPYGGPNYFAMDPAALYEIHLDNTGDGREDITFQFRFNNTTPGATVPVGDANIPAGMPGALQNVPVPLKNIGPIGVGNMTALNFNESYTVNVVRGDRRTGASAAVTNSIAGPSFIKPYDYVGNKTFTSAQAYENYARQFVYTSTVPGCNQPARIFVGQRKEGFHVNLGEVFDLVNIIPVQRDVLAPGVGITEDRRRNDLDDANVTTIGIEIHKSCVAGTNGVVGGWTTASLRQVRLANPTATFAAPDVNGGAWTQVSRLGMPLVNELVIGLPDKDRFSSSQPVNDTQFARYVFNPTLPILVDVLFKDAVNGIRMNAQLPPLATLSPTNYPRNDLATAFATGFPGVNQLPTVTVAEMLRLNTGIAAKPKGMQNNLGLAAGDQAGFPNGRRPGDDTVDIALRVAMGALCHPVPLGANGAPINLGLCSAQDAPVGNVPFTDGAPVDDSDFDAVFPYLRTPIGGSPNDPL